MVYFHLLELLVLMPKFIKIMTFFMQIRTKMLLLIPDLHKLYI